MDEKELKTHGHHILPKHVTIWEDTINKVDLTVEQHAEAHRLLWETFGYYEDYIAWKALSGQIGSDEARRQVVSYTRSQPMPANHKARLKGTNRTEAQKLYDKTKSERFAGANNPATRPEVRKKNSKELKLGYANGRTPWNKGLTKETDIRMAKVAKSVSAGRIGKVFGKRGPYKKRNTNGR